MTELVTSLHPQVNVQLSDQIDMIWVDFETNGLHKDGPVVPFEVGLKLTDLDGHAYAETQRLILIPDWRKWMMDCSDYVHNMHTDSGLFKDLIALDTLVRLDQEVAPTADVVDQAIYNWLTVDLKLPTGRYPMCGSTVHFDRRVMEEHLPLTHSFFHYRNIDVSTVKELCRQLNPPVYQGRTSFMEKKTHRPLADLDASIHEFLFYRHNFLFEA